MSDLLAEPLPAASAIQSADVRPHRLSIWAAPISLVLITGLLHLYFAARFPLAPDETYYWQWSRHLDMGYYDQGPMVAWWIRVSCLLFGDTALGVRAGIIAAAAGTSVFLYLLARDLFGPRIALASMIPAGITPLSMAGGFVATYDPLVVLFWSAGLYFASRALFFESRAAWTGLGVCFGLGLLSKHTMALFGLCLLAFLLASRKHRPLLRTRGPWIGLLTAAVVFSPNLWWQSTHGWMTFRHLFLLTGKGLDQPFGRRFGDFLGSQVGLVSPLLFLLMAAAIWWSGRRGREEKEEPLAFLFWFSGPVLVLFVLMTLKSKVQANWAVCGWLTPPLAVVLWADSAGRRSPRRALYLAGIVLSGVLSAIVAWPEARPVLHVNVPYRWDQMNKLYGGQELADAADAALKQMTTEVGGRVAVGAVTYDNASRMAFYMDSQPDTCCLFPGTRLNSYLLWNDRTKPRPGGAMLLADDYPPDEPKLAPFRALFERVECDSKPVNVFRRAVYDEPVHTFYLYRCYGYRPDPVIEQPSGG